MVTFYREKERCIRFYITGKLDSESINEELTSREKSIFSHINRMHTDSPLTKRWLCACAPYEGILAPFTKSQPQSENSAIKLTAKPG